MPAARYNWFTAFIQSIGFVESKSDTNLFVLHYETNITYLLLFVVDIVLTTSSTAVLRLISTLQAEFYMKDIGELRHFLGMHVQKNNGGLILSIGSRQ